MMGERLAIGVDNFNEIRTGDYYYIDKTLMIRDFLAYKNKVSLITRPRHSYWFTKGKAIIFYINR